MRVKVYRDGTATYEDIALDDSRKTQRRSVTEEDDSYFPW